MIDYKVTVDTSILPDGNIFQVDSLIGPDGVSKRLSASLVDLKDIGVRDALVKLGWTPPADLQVNSVNPAINTPI